jgi:methyl-accepting chemotaxis protein
MTLASPFAGFLLQVVSRPDTIITRTIAERGLLEWTNGILQMLVLVLAVAALITLILLFLALRAGVKKVAATVDALAADAKPMLTSANTMVGDARAMVAIVRQDVERVSDAAGAITDQLLDAAETTAQRVDDVNAVLDVLQDELEDTVVAAASAIRGVRIGAQAMAFGLTRGRPTRRRHRSGDPSDVPPDAHDA